MLKKFPGYLRGRATGEVPGILRDAWLRAGLAAARLAVELDAWQALLRLPAWARAGDTLVFSVRGRRNRPRALTPFDRLVRSHWRAGEPLPANGACMRARCKGGPDGCC